LFCTEATAPSDLFIDTHYIVYRRDEHSATGEDRREREANRFAAALLMPADLLRTEIQKQPFDFGDEEMLPALASKFQISTQAMSIRLHPKWERIYSHGNAIIKILQQIIVEAK